MWPADLDQMEETSSVIPAVLVGFDIQRSPDSVSSRQLIAGADLHDICARGGGARLVSGENVESTVSGTAARMVNDNKIGSDEVYAKVKGLSELSAERRLKNNGSSGVQNVNALHYVLLESPEKGTHAQCVMFVSNGK
eukprot:IDg6356t1